MVQQGEIYFYSLHTAVDKQRASWMKQFEELQKQQCTLASIYLILVASALNYLDSTLCQHEQLLIAAALKNYGAHLSLDVQLEYVESLQVCASLRPNSTEKIDASVSTITARCKFVVCICT